MVPINNVIRLLDSRKIKYIAHDLPLEKLGAIEAAHHMGVPIEQVFKTIVILRSRPKKPLLVLVPGTCIVDLKLLAKILEEKKVVLPSEREAEHVTGLQAGGISPLTLVNKGFQVIVDASAERFDSIFISGGQRGLNLELSPHDLAELTSARFAAISRLEQLGK